jgi:hypothetical protein
LVIDGNMKNNREVCKATAAGFVQYEGLPGHVTTGCQRTPSFKSRFCSIHSPRVCTLSSPDSEEGSIGGRHKEEAVVSMILEKKVTRTNTYYKVIQFHTW